MTMKEGLRLQIGQQVRVNRHHYRSEVYGKKIWTIVSKDHEGLRGKDEEGATHYGLFSSVDFASKILLRRAR